MAAETETLEQVEGRFTWLATEVDGRTVRFWLAIGAAIAAAVLGFGAFWTYGLDRSVARQQTAGKEAPIPVVEGFRDGKEVRFVHTEASDPKVADLLTKMMGSPVPVVRELASVPEAALAEVYVFANGVEGGGPIGFQPDVFDSAPGDPTYSPLRRLNLVRWTEGVEARELTSAAEVEAAASAGEIQITRPGVVINMPFVSWPDGER